MKKRIFAFILALSLILSLGFASVEGLKPITLDALYTALKEQSAAVAAGINFEAGEIALNLSIADDGRLQFEIKPSETFKITGLANAKNGVVEEITMFYSVDIKENMLYFNPAVNFLLGLEPANAFDMMTANLLLTQPYEANGFSFAPNYEYEGWDSAVIEGKYTAEIPENVEGAKSADEYISERAPK